NEGNVNDNDARREGGGLWNQTGSTMTVSRVTINNNTASGAASDDGGGGIFNNGGTLNVSRSTISNNIADGENGTGGGLHVNAGTVMVMLSTFSGNSSQSNGGGIYNNAELTIQANTITLNSASTNGGGLYNNSATSPSVRNTIIAQNTAQGTSADVFSSGAQITSLNYNLIGVESEDFDDVTGDQMGTLANPLIAGLLPLADNGGETLTHALTCPSPAGDMGSDDTYTDQRDEPVFNTRRDIGAFEAQEACSLGTNDVALSTGKSVIYPNPSVNGIFTIDFNENMVAGSSVKIYEIGTGKLVREMATEGSSMQIELSNFATGTYIMQITSDRATETHKLVVGK
ncbi:MAG: T9SS type A sorting domain-containing protein, partial [Flavobacterium sp.]